MKLYNSMKYFIDKQTKGKYYFYKVKQATGKTLIRLKEINARLFNSRKEALDHAMDLKKKN